MESTKPVEQMTKEEIRDELAELTGWTFYSTSAGESWCRAYESLRAHPIDWSLDTISALMPKGWVWTREWEYAQRWWAAFPPGWDGETYPTVIDTDDEKLDRARLVLSVLRLTQEGKGAK